MRARKRDTTHTEVRDAFRDLGFLVLDEGGAVDFLVCDRSTARLWLVDAKTPRKQGGKDTLTNRQTEMLEEGWPIHVCRSVDDVTALVLRWRRG